MMERYVFLKVAPKNQRYFCRKCKNSECIPRGYAYYSFWYEGGAKKTFCIKHGESFMEDNEMAILV